MMDIHDREKILETQHDQRIELEEFRNDARNQRDRENAEERHRHRMEVVEMRNQARVDLKELERRFKPEELDLLFDDYCRRRNVDLQALRTDLALRREDRQLSYELELRFLYREELIAVEGYLYRKIIDVLVAKLLGNAGMTREETDFAITQAIQEMLSG